MCWNVPTFVEVNCRIEAKIVELTDLAKSPKQQGRERKQGRRGKPEYGGENQSRGETRVPPPKEDYHKPILSLE